MRKAVVLLVLSGCSDLAPPANPAPAYDAVYRLDLGERACSAVALDARTYVTAGHCAGIPGLLAAPDGTLYTAAAAEASPTADIAIGTAEGLPTKAQVAQAFPRLGEPVFLGGRGCSIPVRPGLWLGGPESLVAGQVCLGDSGGGVFNRSGELVSIISKRTDYLGYTVPVGEAASLFQP